MVCHQKILPDDNWLELSYIFRVFNDWFDILNARMKFEGNINACGIQLDAQNLVLDEMNHLMQIIKNREEDIYHSIPKRHFNNKQISGT